LAVERSGAHRDTDTDTDTAENPGCRGREFEGAVVPGAAGHRPTEAQPRAREESPQPPNLGPRDHRGSSYASAAPTFGMGEHCIRLGKSGGGGQAPVDLEPVDSPRRPLNSYIARCLHARSTFTCRGARGWGRRRTMEGSPELSSIVPQCAISTPWQLFGMF
jgi:hypothetical protein